MFERLVFHQQQLSDEEKREHTDRVGQTFHEYNTMPDKIVVEMLQCAQYFFDGLWIASKSFTILNVIWRRLT
jgi:hypothetical protein